MNDDTLGALGPGCYGAAMVIVAIPLILFCLGILGDIAINLFSLIVGVK